MDKSTAFGLDLAKRVISNARSAPGWAAARQPEHLR